MHKKNGSDGQMRFTQPHGSVEGLVEVERHEHPADDAVNGVQNPFPSDGSQRDRRHPWKKDQETDEAAPAEGLLQSDS